MHRLVLLALVAACSGVPDLESPYVQLRTVDLQLRHVEPHPDFLVGVSAWEPLGFTFGYEPSGLEECPRRWYEGAYRDCQITMTIVVDPNVIDRTGSDAATDREQRAIFLHPSVLDGDAIHRLIAVAHEAGHVLLDTPEHTAGGIMAGADFVMRDDDRELACRRIHRCL